MALQGLQIHPGVIDQDYTGELKILAQAPQTFVAIAPTDKIAQLVLFPNIKKGKVLTPTPQEDKGFGHADCVY
jgi:dUTPase